MEEFKSLDEVLKVDERNTFFAPHNRHTGEKRSQELKDHHEAVGTFVLNDEAPEKIRSHFNIAKNVLLYAWFVYNFFSVADPVLCVVSSSTDRCVGLVDLSHEKGEICFIPGKVVATQLCSRNLACSGFRTDMA